MPCVVLARPLKRAAGDILFASYQHSASKYPKRATHPGLDFADIMLTPEIVLAVLKHTSANEVFASSAACRLWCAVAGLDELWKDLMMAAFPTFCFSDRIPSGGYRQLYLNSASVSRASYFVTPFDYFKTHPSIRLELSSGRATRVVARKCRDDGRCTSAYGRERISWGRTYVEVAVESYWDGYEEDDHEETAIMYVGVANAWAPPDVGGACCKSGFGYGIACATGQVWRGDRVIHEGLGLGIRVGDVIGIYVDFDALDDQLCFSHMSTPIGDLNIELESSVVLCIDLGFEGDAASVSNVLGS
eukprot:TRINITY_DN64675_c0_g1_i1.p1 TRINITY_DN64675_c0_g1~~TRINITY_DN64675_c0_g1_i1.p1  ORF type:complete len:314 (-),score=11.12 TRINITY_DN64675_c0_g1_i1:61-969(-)